MDGSVAVAGEMNEVVAIYKFSSVFVFEIACFSTSTGFSWDHHGIFATLSSRLVKIPGHKYYFVPTGTQAGHRLKFRDSPGQTGTLVLGNYVINCQLLGSRVQNLVTFCDKAHAQALHGMVQIYRL